jgi:hypothetical protein
VGRRTDQDLMALCRELLGLLRHGAIPISGGIEQAVW